MEFHKVSDLPSNVYAFTDQWILGLAAVFIVFGWVLRSPWFKGMYGEHLVKTALKAGLDPEEYHVLNNLTLPTSDGTTQIDHVMVSRFGIFVVETKFMKGGIYGNRDDAHWTQALYRRNYRFQNPLRQNYKHVKVVQDLLRIEDHQIHNLVAFVGSASPRVPMPPGVVWSAQSLLDVIHIRRMPVFPEDALPGLSEALRNARKPPGFRTRRAHIRHLKAVADKQQKQPSNCPRCGAKRVVRENRTSQERFLGCSQFPKCKATKTLP